MTNVPPNYYGQHQQQPATNHQSTQPSLQSQPARSAPSSGYGSQHAPPMPQLTTNFSPQYQSSPRPTTMASSHSYSRSSPSVSTERYVPFSATTPESSKLPGSSQVKGFIPQTPTGAPSNSPLGLADIRPQAELHMPDDLLSPSAAVARLPSIMQTTSAYQAPWAVYASDWCNWPVPGGSDTGRMAVCSYLEDPHNFIQILDTGLSSSGDGSLEFTKTAEATCAYPVTRILWEPPSAPKPTTNLLATSGDHLRLWSLPDTSPTPQNSSNSITSRNRKGAQPRKLTPLALLSNSKTPEHTAPLTSLDWNKLSPKLIITSSIDTTCTIWDIPTLTAKTQLIAHDKEVFDVRFCAGSVDTFVSCGADGSVRMFDLRSLEHSTIIYEPSEKVDKEPSPQPPQSPGGQQSMPPQAPPLLRIAASPHDSHLLATFAVDSNIIRILDHRQPGQALLELHGHGGNVNCIDWSPNRRGILTSGADDCMVHYWDLINQGNAARVDTTMTGTNGASGPDLGNSASPAGNVKGPAASWRCDFEVANVSWSPSNIGGGGGDWLGVAGGRGIWGVKL